MLNGLAWLEEALSSEVNGWGCGIPLRDPYQLRTAHLSRSSTVLAPFGCGVSGVSGLRRDSTVLASGCGV